VGNAVGILGIRYMEVNTVC